MNFTIRYERLLSRWGLLLYAVVPWRRICPIEKHREEKNTDSGERNTNE